MKFTLVIIIFLLSFQSLATEKKVDFGKLFDQPQKKQLSKTIEKKQTSSQVANKAKSQTGSIATPMTLVGMGAKAMFTCDNCSGSGDYILVDFEGVCGIAGCIATNLKIWGGPGEYKPAFDKASTGTIFKGYQDKIAGTYHWSATLDNRHYCSGIFSTKGDKKNINIRAYSACKNPYINEF
ncbi:MAG: hypothetical protein OCD00_14915 [Colwellia sp.]